VSHQPAGRLEHERRGGLVGAHPRCLHDLEGRSRRHEG
jgi:hypothetical protein